MKFKKILHFRQVYGHDYNPNNMLVYAADYNSHVVHVIDIDTNVIVQTLDVARHPYSVKVDHSTDTVIVTSLAGNAISFLTNNNDSNLPENNESLTHQVATVIESKIGPWGMDINTKKGLAYITNRGADIVTIVDIKEQKITNEIPLQSRGQAVAVDSNNNEIYVGYYQQDDLILRIDSDKGDTNGNVLSMFDPVVASDMEFDVEKNTLYLSLKDANKIIAATPDDIFEENSVNYGNDDKYTDTIEEQIGSALNLGEDDGILEEIEETLEDIGESIEDSATIPDKSEMIQMSGTTLDGTIMVDVYSSKPQKSQSLSIIVEFFDTDSGQLIKGVTHDLAVTQTHEEINSFNEVFADDGTSHHFTKPLATDDPVDIDVKILSTGINPVQMSKGGEVLTFHVVPEFGTIAVMILAVAIISIIVMSARTRLTLISRS